MITASPQAGQPIVPGVHVHYCARKVTLNDRYNAFVRRLRAGRPAIASARENAPAANRLVAEPSGFLAMLRAQIGMALAFPDEGRGWMLAAASAARTQMRDRPFDIVVSSGPPHSSHFAGMLACLGTAARHTIDMRDPWIIGAEWVGRSHSSPQGLRRMIPHLEKWMFRRAHGVVANTAELTTKLRQRFPDLRVSFVSNGVDRERMPKPSTDKFSGLSIAYAGTLYLKRDLTPVLHGMRSLFASNPEARGTVMLRVAGTMDGQHDTRFWEAVDVANLRDSVEFLGSLPSDRALELMNRSHLNIVLAQLQPTQVPAKLYECVALGVPTLVITEATSAAAREAARVGAVSCDNSDVEGIHALIHRLWQQRNPTSVTVDDIGYDAIAVQMEGVLLGGSEPSRRSNPLSSREGTPAV